MILSLPVFKILALKFEKNCKKYLLPNAEKQGIFIFGSFQNW
jgi:hypothetical protein